MKRKNVIIASLILVSVLLIAFVRWYIKRDNSETLSNRLAFYEKNLSLQTDLIISSYKPVAGLINNRLSENRQLSEICSSSSEKSVSAIEHEITTFINTSLPDLGELGFSRVNFIHRKRLTNTHHTNQYNKLLSNFIVNSLKDNHEKTVLHGLFKIQDSIFYQFMIPIQLENQNLGFLELGFDAHTITRKIQDSAPHSDVGFLIMLNDSGNNTHIEHTHFETSKYSPQLLVDHHFSFPNEFYEDKNISKEIIAKLKLLNAAKMKSISHYFGGEGEKVITIVKINFISGAGTAFVASINEDDVLGKTSQLNRLMFSINVVIILFALFGISFLVINRGSILRQKASIQQSEQKLQELNKSKDKFFSIVAHDLKNPFNGIMGLSGYLASDFDMVDDEEKKEIINDINISSKSAFNLLQNLLEWTRAQSGLIKNNPVMIEPSSIIDLALETVTNLAKSKDISLEIKVFTDLKGFADENLVATIIRNLTTNAIKFSPRNSKIEISANKHEQELYFCVKDEGIGLRSDEIDQLFRIDVNFQKKGTEKEAGTGLGLKLCKEFVEYCNGRIWVVSEPGKGSSFYFTIPIFRDV